MAGLTKEQIAEKKAEEEAAKKAMEDEVARLAAENEELKLSKVASSELIITKPEVQVEVVGSGSKVMTAEEYAVYSKNKGTYMGRPEGTKTELSPEEFIVLANAGWSPRHIMDKHGIDLDELRQVAQRVPLIMQLKRPIVVTEKTIKF